MCLRHKCFYIENQLCVMICCLFPNQVSFVERMLLNSWFFTFPSVRGIRNPRTKNSLRPQKFGFEF